MASRRGLGLVALLALLWGSNFLWIKVALDGLSPVQLTFARMAAGTAVLALVIRARSEHLPRGRGLAGHLAASALVGNVVPYLLFAIGEQSVDSALAGVINSTAPLWTVLIALAAHQERAMTPARLVGLVLGFTGAMLIFEPWRLGANADVGGMVACLAASVSYGVSYVYIARYLTPRGLSPFVLAYRQTTAATVLLVPAVAIAGRETIQADASVVAATAVLGFIGTGLAYVVNFAIVARDGATVASTVTYLLPVVAVVLGAMVLGEEITAGMVAGTIVVLLGIALVRSQSAAASTTSPR